MQSQTQVLTTSNRPDNFAGMSGPQRFGSRQEGGAEEHGVLQ